MFKVDVDPEVSSEAVKKYITADDILNHPEYAKSYKLFQDLASKIDTFHYHPHLLYVLRDMLGTRDASGTDIQKVFLEIGSYFGASTCLIMNSDKPTAIFALDTFEVAPRHEELFMNNTFHHYKPIHSVTPVKGNSQKQDIALKVREMLKDRTIDLFFIDGDHRYRPVIHDFLNYHQLVTKGGFIVFDDYHDSKWSADVKPAVNFLVKLFKPWYHIVGSIPNKIGAEAGPEGMPIMKNFYNNFIIQKKFEDVNLNYAIVMATYHRKNGTTLNKIKRAINSIKMQTYQHWTLFLVGDKYENQEEFDEIVKMVPDIKIKYVNLDHAYERELHEDGKIDVRQLWNNAGASAMSKGLDMAKEEGFTHVVHLDDDDFWEPNHLEEINKTYLEFPESIFVYTCGRFLNTIIPRNVKVPRTYGNMPPRGRNLLHSAASWRLDFIDLRYPKIDLESENKKKLDQVLNTPADALMWERVHQFMWKHQYASVYVPKITVNHLEEGADYF